MASAKPETTGASAATAAALPHTPQEGSVTMFTTGWCGYCARLKSQLARAGVPFTEIDIEAAPEHVDFVEQVNGGNRTVPTVRVVPTDGGPEVVMTNPSVAQVKQALAI